MRKPDRMFGMVEKKDEICKNYNSIFFGGRYDRQ